MVRTDKALCVLCPKRKPELQGQPKDYKKVHGMFSIQFLQKYNKSTMRSTFCLVSFLSSKAGTETKEINLRMSNRRAKLESFLQILNYP